MNHPGASRTDFAHPKRQDAACRTSLAQLPIAMQSRISESSWHQYCNHNAIMKMKDAMGVSSFFVGASMADARKSEAVLKFGLLRAAVAGVLAMGIAGTAQADLLAEVRARGTLVCGTMNTIEPMGYLDLKSRKVVGFDVDVCEAVAKGLGVQLEQKSIALEARIPELTLGRVDILSAVLGYTEERAKQIDYTDSHFQVPIRIMVATESPYKKITDLNGKKVGMSSGSTPEHWLRKRFPEVQAITFRDTPAVFTALKQGKIDGEGITQTSGAKLMAAGAGAFRYLDEALGWEPNGLGVRKGEPAFVAAVNKVLVQMEASGEMDRIWNKWLGSGTAYNIKRDKRLTPISQVSAELKTQ
ncbi:transporter substrate-binding domain-containing protein [Cupriavidus sp. IK-TO18]|uniref:transporter substrate-binding domain-containing protein n=1 Tax=Cupriavidus sp. IK-TO18 TaxID=2782182 RepID=UPI002107A1A7|nr:transporter substrate-binding domain-containing protein [Cupriavidus sp. IK-TO18]